MSSESKPAPLSPAWLWTGRVISGLLVLLFLFSASVKFIMAGDAGPPMQKLGWSPKLILALGVVELISAILYALPQTSVLGAILLTGYMGGAIATHLLVGESVYFQVGVGMLLWFGLFLREPRLRAILPWRS